jgi:hypothetical protein
MKSRDIARCDDHDDRLFISWLESEIDQCLSCDLPTSFLEQELAIYDPGITPHEPVYVKKSNKKV